MNAVSRATTLVTGATGFVGSHVVRKLTARGEKVRALVRRNASLKAIEGLTLEIVYGDLTDPASIEAAVKGCQRVYHVAADYRLWTLDPSVLYRVNVQGTRNILEACGRYQIQRVVYTSSVGALGIPKNGQSGHEETPVTLSDMIGHYKRSKFLAEQEAQSAARRGIPVVIVNPSTPVGTHDVKPTATGMMIVDFLNGRMPAYVDTGLNLIDVEDVAQGHLLAMERGVIGERYILGNQNLSLKEILEMLGKVSHLPAPRFQIPRSVALVLAIASTGMSQLTRRPPRVPLEGVRMAGKKMYFDAGKAVRLLELPQHSVEEALEKAVHWFRTHGYVRHTASADVRQRCVADARTGNGQGSDPKGSDPNRS